MAEKEIKSGLSMDVDNLSPDEMRHMLHGLNARLRELEKQNESLRNGEYGEKLNTLTLHMSLAQKISRTGSFEYNIVTNEVIWSDEMFRIFGLLPQSTPLTYENVRNRIHPDDRDLHLQQTKNIITTGSYNFEHRVVWDDGSIHYILGTAEMQPDDDGQPVIMLGTAQDITESKKIEESLRQSESTLRLLIENAPVAIVMFDNKMNYLVASQRWMTDYNLGEREIIGLSHYEIFPEISDGRKAVHQRGLAGEVIQENEDSFLRADGSTQWLKWEVRPWYKVDQTVGGIIIFSEDITKQKQAERLLIESENRYRTLVEQASDGIYMVDDNGNYVDVNTSGYTMLGYTHEEILKMNIRDVVSAEELHKQQLVFSNLKIGQATLTERNLKRKDSTLFQVEINVNKLADGHALGIVRDITERKKTEQALIESREKLRLYLVNSPMAVIEWDNNFVVTRWSGEAEKIFGWSESDTIGKSIIELGLIYEGDEEAIQDVMVQLTSSKSKYVVSINRNYTKSRRVIYCEWYNSISYDSQGKMVSVMSQVLDISERKQTEELLRESEEKFQLISKLSPVGIYTTLPNGECQYVNEFWCKMAGLTFKESLGMGWIQGIHPDDREMVFNNWNKMVESRGKWGQEYRFMDKEGQITWVYGIATPKEDLKGNIIGYIGVNVDITERKQAEQDLREQEEMLNLIFNTVPDPITIIRKDDGVCIQINESFTKVTGWAETDIVGKTSKENNFWVNDEDRIKIVENLIKNGSVENYEAEFRHKNNKIITGLVSAKLINIKGSPCIVSITRDITQRKQIESSLRESENRFRSILQDIESVAVQGYAPDGTTQYWNKASETLYGYSAEEAIGENLINLVVPPEMKDDVRQAMQYMAESGNATPSSELLLMRKDGSRVPVFSSHTIVKIPEKPQELFCIDIDLSELKRAKENYQTLFNEMLDGFALHEIICNENGKPVNYRFLAVNPAFEQSTGLKASEIIGRNVLDIMPDTESYWIETYGNVALTGEPIYFENYSADLHKYFEVTAFRPAPNQFACIFSDITERKENEEEKLKLEAQLQHSLKMESVGRLAGGVAHDFNNMLGVILGHAEMALDGYDLQESLQNHLSEIRKAAERSADLTRQLLAFARKQTVAPKVLDLNETISGMLKMLKRLIGEDIDLNWHPLADLWPVKMDPSQIDQILANLCVNARAAITGVGKITIKTEHKIVDDECGTSSDGFIPGEYICLTVSDDGCGMDKETMEHIFEPFYTTKGIGEGTGLGLATVYGAIKQNNGFIIVDSEPGAGTTFYIYIPRHIGKSEQLDRTNKSEPVIRGQETVLLVEDEPSILKLAMSMLERLGYKVIPASTPGEAMRQAEIYAGEIQILMTDVVMPEMNGRDLAKNLLQLYPKLKRLFMSGYTSDVIAHHGVLDEGVYFIQKPFTMKTLSAKIRGALDDDSEG